MSNETNFNPTFGGSGYNLGWYATELALNTAHPTGNDGEFALVGSTDTVWIWDGDTNAWVDSGSGAIPAGSEKEIQFNDGGSLGADSALTFDKATSFFQTSYTDGDNNYSLVNGEFVVNGVGLTLPFSGTALEDTTTTHQAGVGTFDLTSFGSDSVASGIIFSDGAGNFTNILCQDQSIGLSTSGSGLSITDQIFISTDSSFVLNGDNFRFNINNVGFIQINDTGKMSFLLPSVDFDYAPINLISTGSDPSNLTEGDVWRNGDSLYFKNSTGNVDLTASGPAAFSDADFRLYNDTDNGKQIQFDLSSVSSTTTRTILVPDRDFKLDNIYQSETETNFPCSTILFVASGKIEGNPNELAYFDYGTADAYFRVRKDDVGASINNTMELTNGTAATSGNQEFSPAFTLKGNRWEGGMSISNNHSLLSYSNEDRGLLTIVSDSSYSWGFKENELRTKEDTGIYFNNTFGTDANDDMRIKHDSSTGRILFQSYDGAWIDAMSVNTSETVKVFKSLIVGEDIEVGYDDYYYYRLNSSANNDGDMRNFFNQSIYGIKWQQYDAVASDWDDIASLEKEGVFSLISDGAINFSESLGANSNDDMRIKNDSTTGKISFQYYDGGWTDIMDVDTDGNVDVVGGKITQDGIFGEIYVADNSTAQTIGTGSTYTKLTAFETDGQSSNVTTDADNDKITITETGRYKVTLVMNGNSDTANVQFDGAIHLGGTIQNNIKCYTEFVAADKNYSSSISGIIDVTSVSGTDGDIDVRVRHDDGGDVDLTIVNANLVVEYLGRT
jgi:hypothetical protein